MIISFVVRLQEEFILTACLLPPVQAQAAGESGHACVIFFVLGREAGYPSIPGLRAMPDPTESRLS
jgi:hypothetical protein